MTTQTTCPLCNGNGTRSAARPDAPCNFCKGKKVVPKHKAEWFEREEKVAFNAKA